jgi:adenylate kinase family enzyme
MTIYFLFGKTGAGKTYVANLLSEKKGLLHIDGDEHITEEMREALRSDTQMTREMIKAFIENLIMVIQDQRVRSPDTSFIVSQALYIDCLRHRLLEAFPNELVFVWIDTEQSLREKRISARFFSRDSKVTPSYAKDMDSFFETPTHPHKKLMNNGDDNQVVNTFDQIVSERALIGNKPTSLSKDASHLVKEDDSSIRLRL